MPKDKKGNFYKNIFIDWFYSILISIIERSTLDGFWYLSSVQSSMLQQMVLSVFLEFLNEISTRNEKLYLHRTFPEIFFNFLNDKRTFFPQLSSLIRYSLTKPSGGKLLMIITQ